MEEFNVTIRGPYFEVHTTTLIYCHNSMHIDLIKRRIDFIAEGKTKNQSKK